MPPASVVAGDPRKPLRAAAAGAPGAVLLCAAGLAVAAVAVQRGLSLPAAYVAVVLAAFLAGGAAVLRHAARDVPNGAFGAANRVTLLRGALTSLVLGLLVAPRSDAVAWLAVAVATLALILDGVDGRLARRRGAASAFGARFDMETDALSILILAGLAWHFGKAGLWILLSGLLRYVFVAAGFVRPWLREPLLPSRRRQAVCVVQVATLLVCLVPVVPAELTRLVAAAGLAALAASFAIDIAWLARRA